LHSQGLRVGSAKAADEQRDLDLLVDLEPGRNVSDLGGLLVD
jgi:hypothetical protein